MSEEMIIKTEYSDIMQKSGTFRHSDIYTDFARKKSRQLSHFNRMLQRILSIACSKLHTTEKSDQLRMNSRHAYF